jgi:hypothetical protein
MTYLVVFVLHVKENDCPISFHEIIAFLPGSGFWALFAGQLLVYENS